MIYDATKRTFSSEEEFLELFPILKKGDYFVPHEITTVIVNPQEYLKICNYCSCQLSPMRVVVGDYKIYIEC